MTTTTVLLLVCCALVGAAVGQGEPCTVDQAGTSGDCRHISRCQELLQVLRTAQQQPNSPAIQRLRELARKCPMSATGSLQVCCQNERTRTVSRRVQLATEEQCTNLFIPKVTGGVDATIGEFPWMASIQYSKTPGGPVHHGCGGTLITSRHVLTAAHCVTFLGTPEFPELTPVSVVLGELDFNSQRDCLKTQPNECSDDPITVHIDHIFAHPDFENIKELALPNDIAVVRLAREVTFTQFIRPACILTDLSVLSRGKTDISSGQNGKVAGWGQSDISAGRFTPILQTANLPIRDLGDCEEAFGLKLPKRICAGGGPNSTDTCRGDSGGPLMVAVNFGTHLYQTGISSFGTAVCGNVAGYTRIFDYRNWIIEQINK